MKKLSKIVESIWSDIQDRSSGETIRQEDDPNLLEPQGFVEYLRNLYKNVDTEFYIFKDLNDIITVPAFETDLGTKSTWFIEYDCNKKEVYIWAHHLNEDDKLFEKLKRKYKLLPYKDNNRFGDYFIIAPKIGKSSNTFFIEIIDYILENASVFFHRILVKNDKVTESIWSDIQDRSSGDTVRKEDDVDNMDKDTLWDYLRNDLYKQTSTIYDIRFYIHPYDCILVPISINGLWSSGSVTYLGLEGFDDPKGMVVTLDERSVHRLPEGVFDILKTKYSVKYVKETSRRQAYEKIYPKDGRLVTNSFYIEVIDFLLDNIRDDYNRLVKKIK